jgi:uncharacterized protein YqhQ
MPDDSTPIAAQPDRYNPPVPKGEYLQFGGQAVIEGVMMRSPHYYAVAVRAPNGEIIVDSDAHEKSWLGRQKWLRWPFFRGALGLIDGLMLGYKSLRFAANVQVDPKYQPQDAAERDPDAPGSDAPEGKGGDKVVKSNEAVKNFAVGGAMVGGLALGLFLFNYLPNALAIQFKGMGVTDPTLINFITEVIKIVFFFAYILAIAQLPDIKRLFKYHGAEHKAINVIENDLPLTLENVQKQTRLHPRCGTSFAIVVLIVSMVFFTFLPKPEVLNNKLLTSIVRFLFEIPFLPVIAGISYEMIRFAGKMRNAFWVKMLFAPGLATQYITTREPEPDQIEVAMVSLQAVLDLEAAHGKPEAERIPATA